MQKITTNTSEILHLTNAKFLLGEQAIHPKYGLCKIISAKGTLRTISASIIGEEKIRLEVRHVHVGELSPVTTSDIGK